MRASLPAELISEDEVARRVYTPEVLDRITVLDGSSTAKMITGQRRYKNIEKEVAFRRQEAEWQQIEEITLSYESDIDDDPAIKALLHRRFFLPPVLQELSRRVEQQFEDAVCELALVKDDYFIDGVGLDVTIMLETPEEVIKAESLDFAKSWFEGVSGLLEGYVRISADLQNLFEDELD